MREVVSTWGVGNAPSRYIRGLSSESGDIDVVFSLMKCRPQAHDVSPTGVLVWRTYFDNEGDERPLPKHVLVISREQSDTGSKSVHYALVCNSNEELRLADFGVFDPTAYRNIGDGGGPIGNSQVTALVVRTRDESPLSDYRINFRAKLAGGYWVRLGRPRSLNATALTMLSDISSRATEVAIEDWTKAVAGLRADSVVAIERQPSLFQLPTP